LRSIEEIRSSIKDLIQKAESEELLKSQSSDGNNIDPQLPSENDLSEEIMEQINLEVSEFQKAFKEQGAEGLIAQSVRDSLKPVLDEWLKTNLPIIVSEVIDEKISEITKKT
jgi:cell pole-organizing protein PopZ